MEGSFESLLPEVLHGIFGYLDASDLSSASMVCRHWRSVANSEILWKRICEREGIFDEYVDFSGFGRDSNLCHWASVYGRYHENIAENWKSDCYLRSEFPCEVENIVIHGKTMVVSFLTWRVICVFKLEGGSFIKKEVLSPNIPGNGGHFVCLKNNGLIVASNNIAIVYKSGIVFNKIGTFAIFESVTSIEDELVSDYFSDDLLVEGVNLNENFIWLFDPLQNHILIYNFNNKTTKILNSVLSYVSYKEKNVVIFEKSIGCFSCDGTQLANVDYKVESNITFNDKYFCFFTKTEVVSVNYEGAVYRFNVENPKNMIIQRKKDLIYILSTSEVSFLQCFTIEGNLIWKKELCKISDRVQIYEVLGKYLILYPFISRDLGGAMGVYDINGDFLYYSDLIGRLLLCENRFIVATDISMTERRIKKYLRSYAACERKEVNLVPLNRSAYKYNEYHRRILENYRKGVFEEIETGSSIYQITINQYWMFLTFFGCRNIEIYRLKSRRFHKIQTLDSDFLSPLSLFSCDDNLLVTFDNIIVLYSYKEQFKFEKVFALKTKNEILCSDNNLYKFKDDHLNLEFMINWAFTFQNEIMFTESNSFYYICRSTGSLLSIFNVDNIFTTISVSKNEHNIFHDDKLTTFYPKRKFKTINVPDCFKSCINICDDTICYIEHHYIRVKRRVVMLNNSKVNESPIENPLAMSVSKKMRRSFVLNWKNGYFYLSSVDIKNVETVWCAELDVRSFQHANFRLHIILDRFIMLYPIDQRKYGIYSIDDGKYMYSRSVDSLPLLVQDRFIISSYEKTVKSFL